MGRGWLAANDGRRRDPDRGGAGARGSDVAAALRAPVREDFDTDTLPIDFQWLRSPRPDELFSLRARPGHLRLYGRETIGSLFRRRSSRAASAGALLQRIDMRGVRARALPADGRPRVLLQQRQVSLLLRVTRRQWQASPGDVGAPRSGRRRRVHAADRDRERPAHRAARGSGLRAAALCVSNRRRSVAVAAAAVRCQHSLGRGQRAGVAELHGGVRRHGMSGSRRDGDSGRLRLVRVS